MKLTFDLGRIPEGIAALAAQYHCCELIGVTDNRATFLCPSLWAGNAMVTLLYDDRMDEVEVHVVEVPALMCCPRLN